MWYKCQKCKKMFDLPAAPISCPHCGAWRIRVNGITVKAVREATPDEVKGKEVKAV